jgi:hypothetical protein
MAKYTPKPPVVEAIQYTEATVADVYTLFGTDGIVGPIDGVLSVLTPIGAWVFVNETDWIIAYEEPGRFYPVENSVFQKTYMPAV